MVYLAPRLPWPHCVPLGGLLVGVGHFEDCFLASGTGSNLKAHRQAPVIKAAGQRHGGTTGQVEDAGEQEGQAG